MSAAVRERERGAFTACALPSEGGSGGKKFYIGKAAVRERRREERAMCVWAG